MSPNLKHNEGECKRLCRYIKALFSFFFFLTFFFTVSSSVYAATRYVNADSDGSASNPTRAFDNPSYTANDSYQTLTAAYNAVSAGDIIEFSGGTSGKTYITGTNLISKSITLRGSRISSHNGPVTIDYTGSTNYTIGVYADNIVIDNLHIVRTSGSGSNKVALWIFKNNALIENSIIDSLAGDYAVYIQTGIGVSNTFQNCVINSRGSGRGIILSANANSVTFNNCIIVKSSETYAVALSSGSVSNFNNCIFTSNGTTIYNGILAYSDGGVFNTNNCFIQGIATDPQTIMAPWLYTFTWNSSNDTINGFPYFTKTKENVGDILLSTDDLSNIDYFISIASYAMSTYGVPLTFYVDESSASLGSINKTKLQTLVKAGHEIGLHTKHHSDLSLANAFSVTYSGSNTDMALVVSGSGTTLNITGTSDTHGPIDLTSNSYNTIGKLCTVIGTYTNFTCTILDQGSGSGIINVLATSLKDATTNLPCNVATNIPFDDDTGPNNRRYKDEITNTISDIESAIYLDPTLSSYRVKTMAFPYNASSSQVINWIQANTSLIAVRSSSYISPLVIDEQLRLENINLFDISRSVSPTLIKGPNYSSLTTTEQKSRIEQAARTLSTYVSHGIIIGILNHNASNMTVQEFQWFLDELMKYKSQYNIGISTLTNIVTDIKTSGNWTDAGNGFWTRTFSGDDDFRLRYSSSLINSGINISGRTTDILGNSLVGTPDIGAYEFQAPASPGTLAQYQSDGTTSISTNKSVGSGSTVIFKFSMSSSNSSDSLTPQIEVKPIGTAFINSANYSGSAVSYSGTAVTGTVTVPNLGSGNYHWQARVSNAAGQGSWTSFGGNSESDTDFSIGFPAASAPSCSDTVPASAPWLYNVLPESKNSIRIYFTDAKDPVDKYVLEYGTKSGVYQFSSTNIGGKGTKTYLVEALSPNTTYYFRVRGGNGCATGPWSNEMSAKTKSISHTVSLDLGTLELKPKLIKKSEENAPSEQTNESPGANMEQTPTAGYDVKVKVTDTNKNPVEGAKVTLHSKVQEAITNKEGIAEFKGVEPGEHKVLIAYKGFEGEQAVNLTGDVKEFNLNVTVQQKVFSLSPLTYGIIIVMALVILALVILLIKNRKRRI